MLLTKEVEVTINRKNLDWYIIKGYNCKLKDTIVVSVTDLMIGSNEKVTYKCDMCGIEKLIKFTDYIKSQKLKPNTYCNKCANIVRKNNENEKYFAKNNYKICKKCNRKLPANTDYYFKTKHNKDSFSFNCKECDGYSFTNHLTKIPQDGYKFCIKCDRELPNDIKHFPPDKMCKDGLRNVCRECGKDGHFMNDSYKSKHFWQPEENKLFIIRYSQYTCEELINNFYPDFTPKQIWDNAYRLRISNDLDLYKTKQTQVRANLQKSVKMSGENSPMFGVPKSDETKRKLSISKTGKYVGENNALYGIKWSKEDKRRFLISERTKGLWSGENNPRHKNPLNGKLNGRWQGGRTPLYFELRSEIKAWKIQSMENCHYKCVLTNGKFDNIHHLYPFKNIVNEVFESLGLDQRRSVSDYTETEFNNIKIMLYELHNKYGLGVCLRKDVHKLFHDLYGYTNNTLGQFREFTLRFKVGEFKDIVL